MARKRSHTDRRSDLPVEFLRRCHNKLLREQPSPSWRIVKRTVDERRSHLYDSIEDPMYADGVILLNRVTLLETKHNMTKNLPEPFGSAPRFPGQYELNFTFRNSGRCIHVFASKYSAQHFILAVLNKRKLRWIDTTRATCEDITITSPHLEDIMGHEMTPLEQSWKLPYPYTYYAHNIATCTPFSEALSESVRSSKNTPHDDTSKREHRQTGETSRPERTRKRNKRSNDTPTAPKRSPSRPEGTTIGIPDIANATKLEPTAVRRALRKSTTPKPDAGWVWPAAELNDIVALVKKFSK